MRVSAQRFSKKSNARRSSEDFPQALIEPLPLTMLGFQSLARHLRADVDCPTQLLALIGGTDESPVADYLGGRAQRSITAQKSTARRMSWNFSQALLKAV